MEPTSTELLSVPPHNLGLYRLEGFSGYREELLQLHEWLTGGDDLPAIAISGERGIGKTTLATAAGWNHLHDFRDGVIRVSAAGAQRFRLYDVVRTMDSVFGTELTRLAEERWGISVLEQLYRRRRLLIIDKLAGATAGELQTLVDIISHLHETAGNSRILLLDRNFSPETAALVQHQHIRLAGIRHADLPLFIERRAPSGLQPVAHQYEDELYTRTAGHPLLLRLMLGLLLDLHWDELAALVQENLDGTGRVQPAALVALAVENFAVFNPQVGPLLNRLVSAAGGASYPALRELFWMGLGTATELDRTIDALVARGLLDYDLIRQRVAMHPLIRSYLEENAVMLGEDWERTHARYYLRFAQKYHALPLARWPEVDIEWGNIARGVDWCIRRVRQLWSQELMNLLRDPELDQGRLALPETSDVLLDDLRTMRDYGLALAHYAFWRHPPGVLEWLAGGAAAALAVTDMRNYGLFLMNIGRQLFFRGAVEEAILWLERADQLFDQRDLLIDLSYVLTDLGTTYRALGDSKRALGYFQAAFDSVAQAGAAESLATAYMNLGSAYYSLNNFDRALQEQRKALRVALRRDESHQVASSYNNMGLAMEAMDRLIEAQQAYEHALDVFRRIEDLTGISACYNNLGSVCYAQGNYGQALMWYELDLRLCEKRGAWTDMAATLHNLGHVAAELGEPERAIAYFKQSRDLYAAFQLTEYVAEEEEMIALMSAMQEKA
jgi:tetratricopeptide (TPR) repeat protein